MTNRIAELKIHYKLDQVTPVNPYEMKAYNVPFAGNVSSCRETFLNGERVLEYTMVADMCLENLMHKPMFRDEIVEYLYSFSKQLVSMVQNGLNLNKVAYDLKYMFVKLDDFSLQLIYLPLDTQFPKVDVGDFIKKLLLRFVFAQTSSIECANQIIDYFQEHMEFDAFQFNNFMRELRATSQILTIQNEMGFGGKELEGPQDNVKHMAMSAARDAERAKAIAENEANRQLEEARRQGEIAKQAEADRMRAEAARIEAEIAKQQAAAEISRQAKTAILFNEEVNSIGVNNSHTDALKQQIKIAETAAREAEERRRNAEIASSRYADEARRARETEMRAEEAKMHAEYEAKRIKDEASKQVYQAQQTLVEAETTVLNRNVPVLMRKSTGQIVEINRQVFCIGKADQGVDYKITGNKSISRRHAYITTINGVYYLRDNNSTNHTYVNGQMIYSNIDVPLQNNSTIKFSNEEFVFCIN